MAVSGESGFRVQQRAGGLVFTAAVASPHRHSGLEPHASAATQASWAEIEVAGGSQGDSMSLPCPASGSFLCP